MERSFKERLREWKYREPFWTNNTVFSNSERKNVQIIKYCLCRYRPSSRIRLLVSCWTLNNMCAYFQTLPRDISSGAVQRPTVSQAVKAARQSPELGIKWIPSSHMKRRRTERHSSAGTFKSNKTSAAKQKTQPELLNDTSEEKVQGWRAVRFSFLCEHLISKCTKKNRVSAIIWYFGKYTYLLSCQELYQLTDTTLIPVRLTISWLAQLSIKTHQSQ